MKVYGVDIVYIETKIDTIFVTAKNLREARRKAKAIAEETDFSSSDFLSGRTEVRNAWEETSGKIEPEEIR